MKGQKRPFDGKNGPGGARHISDETFRHCTSCGQKIFGFVHELETIRKCPHKFCHAPIPLLVKANEFRSGLGRCPKCKLYIQEIDVYCQACGLMSRKAWEAREERERERKVREEAQKIKEIKGLKDVVSDQKSQLDSQSTMIEHLQRQLAEAQARSQGLNEKEVSSVVETMDGVDFEEMVKEDDLLKDESDKVE